MSATTTFRSENLRAAAGELLDAALSLAARRPVLPLEPAGKVPLGGYGLQHATRDTDVVRGWWREWPQANVGVRCDGLAVVDVDGTTGERSLTELERRFGPLPPTRT